ncbi:hypothetical protein DE146DRAFT_154956 [Phaeosphaeria sp. MPI-PUGE-AT-0046c]|nr:hypothetical protein DE146DRAFT_154956 [Phaeosphaeria sp. MPI-PUGE-AT-0046c]
MAGNYSYDRLGNVHESQGQDITEAQGGSDDTQAIFRPLDSQVTLHPFSVSDYSLLDQYDTTDRASLKNFETLGSNSSRNSISKLKTLGARLRRKPLPRHLRSSTGRHAAVDIEPARIGRGVWRDQLLSDRSLRGMAVLMTALAIGMIIVVVVYADTFASRANLNSSSVGGKTQSCKRVSHINTALLLLINVCATMVLGMSNTYQQLVTSLKISDLKHALSTFGDARVGTNSPFSIKHKKEGKKIAWASWVLLIFTSMPVHFLANSLIGPSFTQELPTIVDFDSRIVPKGDLYYGHYSNPAVDSGDDGHYNANSIKINSDSSFPCWSAFRTGTPHYTKSSIIMSESSDILSFEQGNFDATYERIVVHYNSDKCQQYKEDLDLADIDMLENSILLNDSLPFILLVGDCMLGHDVKCSLHDPGEANCRLNIRMSAAFTLMACLVIKAIYSVCHQFARSGKEEGTLFDNWRRHSSLCFSSRTSSSGGMYGERYRQLPTTLFTHMSQTLLQP